MNEVLAIIVFAFFAERIRVEKDLHQLKTEDIVADSETLTGFIFDSRHTFADIFSIFNRILGFGIKNLYLETKDISELRKELVITIFFNNNFYLSLKSFQSIYKVMIFLFGNNDKRLKKRK